MSVESNSQSLPPYSQQFGVENRNFLSPIGFQFVIGSMKSVEFFCQSATIPAISTKAPATGTRFNQIYHPGDELMYEDLVIKFLVDENMKNYYQVHDWLREITTPYSSKEFTYNRNTIQSANKDRNRTTATQGTLDNQWKSDCSLFVLSSNYQPVAEFIFRDAFPIALTPVNFDSSVPTINYFTAEVKLRYNYFDPYIGRAATVTDASMKSTYHVSKNGVDLDSM